MHQESYVPVEVKAFSSYTWGQIFKETKNKNKNRKQQQQQKTR